MFQAKKGGAKGAAEEAMAALLALEDGGGGTATMEMPADPPKKGKKGKKGGNAAAAAAAALDAIEGLDDFEEPVMTKKQAKAAAKAALLNQEKESADGVADAVPEKPAMSKKQAKAAAKAALLDQEEAPAMSKKQAKAAAQAALLEQEEAPAMSKKQAQAAAKAAVEAEPEQEAEEFVAQSSPVVVEKEEISLEEKKKRERGSARVRVVERSGSGTASMRLEKASMVFKNTEVLKDATWGVRTGDRVGVVGGNGEGKSTQLKILAGELEPTTGEVTMSSDRLKVSLLRQEFAESLDESKTLIEELASVFGKEAELLSEISQLERELESATDDEQRMSILDKLGNAQELAKKKGAYAIEAKAEKVAIQMGFGDADLGALVGSFSGGWKMRIGIAKVLLEQPDVWLLDEPTNHLDLESVEWLESFLSQQTVAMAIVSHDREFLDNVCNRIVDTEGGTTTTYDDVNYSVFLKRKAQRRSAWEAAYKKQQAKIQEDKAFINRFRTGSRAQQAKSRERQLEKLLNDPTELIERPPVDKKGLRFRFPDPPRCGVEILTASGLTHGYGGRTLFSDVDIELKKGDRVAIVGPNGAGKSTLLRLLAGIEEPDQGSVAQGSANVLSAYFAQNQADALDMSKTVIKTIEDASAQGSTEYSYEQLRGLLGQFKFRGDDVHKKLESLSGGEKARVALCAMMLRPYNCLMLDEPTNHLDIPAKETLEDALRHFDGTLVCVTHDRYFISQVANTIFTLEDGKLERFDGDYASYLESREDLAQKVEDRYIQGDRTIQHARFVDLDATQKVKKNFGGKKAGVSGRKDKGVKNAKRSK